MNITSLLGKKDTKPKKPSLTKWLPSTLRGIKWLFDRLDLGCIFFVGVKFNLACTMLMQLSLKQKGHLKMENSLANWGVITLLQQEI